MKVWCRAALVGDRVESDVEVSIVDGRFADVVVGTTPSPGAEQRQGLTLPGLANGHSHAFHRALRGRTQAQSGSFWTWRHLMYAVAERLDPDNYRRLATAVFAEMVGAGVTSVGEFHYVHHNPDGSPYDDPNAMGHALIEAAATAGLRITLLDTLYQHGGLDRDGYQPATGVQRRYCDPSPDGWRSRLEKLEPTENARSGAAIHSVRAVDPAGLGVAAGWAAETDAPLHAHLSEQPAENEACLAHHEVTPTRLLADAGPLGLGSQFTAVHGTHLTERDIDALGRANTSVCFCPTTEQDLGDGIGPSRALVSAGASITLGTDSHSAIDLFEEARLVEYHQRLETVRRGIHPTAELIAMATVNGHRSLGWNDAGTIAVGARADLVTVDLSSSARLAGLASAGNEHLLGGVLFAAGPGDITDVMIDGVPVLADGHHLSVDVARSLESAVAEVTADA